ncbi:FAD/NAD(P)-binding protein [Paludisphaera mucosa]|uniref:FAD/NAD(P)-binding protein n=1 Tax=Paludisphaera mucosa TaxID=3030827 RepID=A0ABT6F667_9BACT|nr:FAD/NAD(P)-binding protein [Paludisphaera mucosa]MDG3003083.1 FAD/NAD(P)-binding protein [Paludisphaera mucosa]
MPSGSTSGLRDGSVGIVGGGFSGTMTALHILRHARSSVRVDLFERSHRVGPGVAYGTSSAEHLLNVPARMMSGWPDEPDHFANWLIARTPGAGPGVFAPRRLYGEYLAEMLQEAAATYPDRLRMHEGEIVDVREESDGLYLGDERGDEHRVDALVLATGNSRPRDPFPVPDELRLRSVYLGDPWACDPLAGLEADADVVLIGSGLTAVDVVVDAEARGFRGRIRAVSRHGLTPSPHAPALGPAASPFEGRELPRTARSLLRGFRDALERDPHGPANWRAVVDALRPQISELWRALDDAEKRRFVDRVGTYWEIHRHRVAPAVFQAVERAKSTGRFRVVAGRPVGIDGDRKGAALAVASRCSGAITMEASRVVNCTGPARDVRRHESALTQALLARGTAIPGTLGMGLATDEHGRLKRADGQAWDRGYAIGPLLKGSLWETTAVRELRQQAADLGRRLAERLDAPPARVVPRPHWKRMNRRSPRDVGSASD